MTATGPMPVIVVWAACNSGVGCHRSDALPDVPRRGATADAAERVRYRGGVTFFELAHTY